MAKPDKFVYYQATQKAATAALRSRLFEIADLRMRPNADGTGWLIRSPEEVTRASDKRALRSVQESEWAASLSPKPPSPVRGIDPSLIALEWRVVPGTRQARVSRVRLAPKRAALRVLLGGGKGDGVAIEVDVKPPESAVGLRLDLRAPSGVPLSIAPSLRGARGRLTSLSSKPVAQGGSVQLDWKLPALKAEERARIEGLVVNINTDADVVGLLLFDVAFSV